MKRCFHPYNQWR